MKVHPNGRSLLLIRTLVLLGVVLLVGGTVGHARGGTARGYMDASRPSGSPTIAVKPSGKISGALRFALNPSRSLNVREPVSADTGAPSVRTELLTRHFMVED